MTLLRPLLVVAFLFFGCLRAQVVWERIGSGAQFVSAHEPDALRHMLELSAVFMAMTFLVFLVYGLFAAAVRDRVINAYEEIMRMPI